MQHLDDLFELVSRDPWFLTVMRLLREQELPQAWVTGEVVRTTVWDQIHSRPDRTQVKSVELVYWDPKRTDVNVDRHVEGELFARSPRKPWVVKNLCSYIQHVEDESQHNIKDVLRTQHSDTASVVGMRLTSEEKLQVLDCGHIEDLVNVIARPTTPDKAGFLRRRIGQERWQKKWPKLKVEDIPD